MVLDETGGNTHRYGARIKLFLHNHTNVRMFKDLTCMIWWVKCGDNDYKQEINNFFLILPYFLLFLPDFFILGFLAHFTYFAPSE